MFAEAPGAKWKSAGSWGRAAARADSALKRLGARFALWRGSALFQSSARRIYWVFRWAFSVDVGGRDRCGVGRICLKEIVVGFFVW